MRDESGGSIEPVEDGEGDDEEEEKEREKEKVKASTEGGEDMELVWGKAAMRVAKSCASLSAKVDVTKGGVIWTTNKYLLPVLYSQFTQTHCGSCFQELAAVTGLDKHVWRCNICRALSLCSRCATKEAKEWHERECDLYCEVPLGMRKGDTDYLRFVCRFFALCTHGKPPAFFPGSGLQTPTKELDQVFQLRCKKVSKCSFLDCLSTNEKLHDQEFKSWSRGFAELFKKYVAFPTLEYSVQELQELLMRIKTNALGFPCSDKYGTLGWSLDLYASFLDHSCSPNCKVDMDGCGKLVVEAVREIRKGEALLISYVAEPETVSYDERKKRLWETYKFACRCERCVRDYKCTREATRNGMSVKDLQGVIKALDAKR